MTNISKIPLDRTTYAKIRKNFLGAVSNKHSYGPEILDTLLTKSERIMLAKRLAIIILLERGSSHNKICRILKVGMPTVVRIDHYRERGRYPAIQRAINIKVAISKNDLTLMEHLELVLSMGMPSIAGPNSTKRLNELRRKKRERC